MAENVLVILAALYASVVVLSYRKVGFVTALIWPVSMFLLGMIIYINVMLTPPKE